MAVVEDAKEREEEEQRAVYDEGWQSIERRLRDAGAGLGAGLFNSSAER